MHEGVERCRGVALLAEGVDRNWLKLNASFAAANVALLAEGVDRNGIVQKLRYNVPQSPSSRRAWIEIVSPPK